MRRLRLPTYGSPGLSPAQASPNDGSPRDHVAQTIYDHITDNFAFIGWADLDIINGEGTVLPRELADALIEAGLIKENT